MNALSDESKNYDADSLFRALEVMMNFKDQILQFQSNLKLIKMFKQILTRHAEKNY